MYVCIQFESSGKGEETDKNTSKLTVSIDEEKKKIKLL